MTDCNAERCGSLYANSMEEPVRHALNHMDESEVPEQQSA